VKLISSLNRNLAAAFALSALMWAQGSVAQAQTSDPPQSQNPGTDSGQGSSDEGLAAASGESRAPVPLPLSVDVSTLQYSPEQAQHNFLQGGIELRSAYDDNLLSTSSNHEGGLTYSVMPQISLNLSRPRLFTSLSYSGGYAVNQRFSTYNQTTQAAGADVRYRLTPHVNVRVSDNFIYTSSFFDQQQGTFGVSGILQGPNQNVITPLSRHTDNFGTADVTYQYSAGDMVGASTTSFYSRYRDVPKNSIALLDTRTEEADGFYTHRVTPRNWSGVAYKFQHLSFDPATQDVDTHSFLAFHTVLLKPRMSVAVFGGAEYSDLTTQIVTTVITLPAVTVTSVPVERKTWSWTAGAAYLWQGERTSVSANWLRKVSDGGGLLSGVELLSGGGGLRRQLTRTTEVTLGGSYGDSRGLAANSGLVARVKSGSGSVALEQRMGKSISATLGYGRDYQQQSGSSTPVVSLNTNHNRGWISLRYEFTRPLGR
jgi:hypothetical protein